MHCRWVEDLGWLLHHGHEEEYRVMLGIHPDQHERLIALLKENEATGLQRWQQIIEQLQNERPPAPDEEPYWSLLNKRLTLPDHLRNQLDSRLKREFLASQQRLIDQSQNQEYERITGISTRHHQTMMVLLGHAMDTGDSNFDEIRQQIEEETRRKRGGDFASFPERNS